MEMQRSSSDKRESGNITGSASAVDVFNCNLQVCYFKVG